MSCPDENLLVAFAGGAVDGAQTLALETHLDGCASCRKVLAAVAIATGAQRPAAPKLLPAGTQLGRYRIERLLGAGAMGVVYEALDPELNRKVALKLILADRAAPEEARGRILREAQAMAKLAHPNVVHVYELGADGDRVFIAMELSPGTSLAEWLRTPRPVREILAAFLQAGRGLEAAHRAGVVHRDFKPHNVLIDPYGRVRVTGFGLAFAEVQLGRASAPMDGAGARLTQVGTVMGTPRYMAPEQREGRADARSDQYSFCLSLLEALAGEVDRPPALARRPRGVPAHLWPALRRGLQPSPQQRFADMGALLSAIERPPRKTPVAIAAGVAVAMGALAVVLSVEPSSPPPGSGVEAPEVRLAPGQTHTLPEENLARVAVGDPQTADVRVGEGGQVLIEGRAPGITTLILWTSDGTRTSREIRVQAPVP